MTDRWDDLARELARTNTFAADFRVGSEIADALRAAYAEGYKRGQEEMRERAVMEVLAGPFGVVPACAIRALEVKP